MALKRATIARVLAMNALDIMVPVLSLDSSFSTDFETTDGFLVDVYSFRAFHKHL
jgi:hypothetical protein